jgi:aminoglycoside phosphotransferase (APT) family kinase protein
MSRLEGQNFKCILSDGRDSQPYLVAMARLHIAIHGHRTRRLPTLRGWLAGEIRKAELKRKAFPTAALLDRLAAIPDGDQLCHGDFHTANVIGDPNKVSVVDWTSAKRGYPAIDVCQSWLLMQREDPGLADSYVNAYAAESGSTTQDILRWRAIVAGARLADDVPGEVEMLERIVTQGLA